MKSKHSSVIAWFQIGFLPAFAAFVVISDRFIDFTHRYLWLWGFFLGYVLVACFVVWLTRRGG
jgi:hypothetical protein